MSTARKRLESGEQAKENWRLVGSYLAEKVWETVREDYSEDRQRRTA